MHGIRPMQPRFWLFSVFSAALVSLAMPYDLQAQTYRVKQDDLRIKQEDLRIKQEDLRIKQDDLRIRSGASVDPKSNYSNYQKAPKKDEPLPKGYSRLLSGTGFFVSNRGYVVTNQHVVEGCSQVMMRGAVDPVVGQVVSTDAVNDLALIRTEALPNRIATMRISDKTVREGDSVMVMGYPKEHGITGVYSVEEASVVGLEGPMHEPTWIQFSSSAQEGNSGGPLLDTSGNVIGVIVGKTKMFRKVDGKAEVTRESDVAISLPVLKGFLEKNNVSYRSNYSQNYLAVNRLENQARDYIVNIHCNAGGGQASAH